MVHAERKSWNNEQYSTRKCLEIPETVTENSLERTALNIFKEMGVSIGTSDIKACYRVGPPSRKKVIIKLSRRKDADREWWGKKPFRV